jgi:predicted nucleotidyltransferase
MTEALWHERTIRDLATLLSDDDAVRGLVVIGSCARSDVAPDPWSDIDLAVVVAGGEAGRFFPATDWISRIGVLYALSPSEPKGFGVLRTQFVDGRRIDFVIIPESSLGRIDEWEFNPLRYGNHVLLSRSPALDQVLSRKLPPSILKPLSAERFAQMCNDFRFKSILAVSKAARNELLVALHLSLDLIRDCLVLAMCLRDRQTGTDHHRNGIRGNCFVNELAGTRQPYMASGILDSIEQSAIAFDKLAAQWSGDYQERRQPLLDYVERVRVSFKEQECGSGDLHID